MHVFDREETDESGLNRISTITGYIEREQYNIYFFMYKYHYESEYLEDITNKKEEIIQFLKEYDSLCD